MRGRVSGGGSERAGPSPPVPDGQMSRALLISHNCGLFGAERSLLSLACGLQQSGHWQITVAVPRRGALADACRDARIPVVVGNYGQWVGREKAISGPARRLARNLMAGAALAAHFVRHPPEIVYTSTGATPQGAILARVLGVPHVWHLREFMDRDHGLRFDLGRRLTMRIMRHACDAVIFNSEAVRGHFSEAFEDARQHVIYNGFELPGGRLGIDPQEAYRRRVEDADPIVLLLPGALVPGKGQMDAVRALALLVARGWRVRLVLAGDGDDVYRRALMREARALGVEAHWRTPGFIKDLSPCYDEAALTLICARCEAFGRTAVESLSLATPVIGTDAGGLPEIIGDGRHGALYPPGDAAALADAVERMLRDREHYVRCASEGREMVFNRFQSQRYVDEIAAVFDAVKRRDHGYARQCGDP